MPKYPAVDTIDVEQGGGETADSKYAPPAPNINN